MKSYKKHRIKYSDITNDITKFNISTSKDIASKIAVKVRDMRQDLGLSKTEMAIRAGVGYPHYLRFEQTGEIPFKELLQIGFVLNALPDFEALFSRRQFKSLYEASDGLQGSRKTSTEDTGGDYFAYQQHVMKEIERCIERDIARASRRKPAKIHEECWFIVTVKSPGGIWVNSPRFKSLKEAEAYLTNRYKAVKSDYNEIEHKYVGILPEDGLSFLRDNIVFQSAYSYMTGTPDDEQVPVLYIVYHNVSEYYPSDALVLSGEMVEIMKEAYRQIRIAGIYVDCVDLMMSIYNGKDLEAEIEDFLRTRLKDELEALDEEVKSKNWSKPGDK